MIWAEAADPVTTGLAGGPHETLPEEGGWLSHGLLRGSEDVRCGGTGVCRQTPELDLPAAPAGHPQRSGLRWPR
jgi:hypothetical protein